MSPICFPDKAHDRSGGLDPLVGHDRDNGPHVRGCWVLDLVLGKS
jgi:hypothetical protein